MNNKCQTLYEYWVSVLAQYEDVLALRHPELSNGWTFRDLDMESKKISLKEQDFIVASADQLDFLPTIVAAWRENIAVLIKESHLHETRAFLSSIPANTVLIKQTCGGSGVERSIFMNSDQLISEANKNVTTLSLSPNIRGISAVSLAHSYGLGCLTLPCLLFGVPIDYVNSGLPFLIEDVLSNSGKYFLPGVPALWKTWHLSKILHREKIALGISAGSPLSCELESSIWEDTGIKVHNFYGTSETGAIAYDDSLSPRKESSYVGSVISGVEVKIDDKKRINVFSNSKIIDSDRCLYDAEFTDEFYKTQDTGLLRPPDQLHLTGFVGKAINVAGRKVSPERIERLCLELDGVKSAKVHSIRSRDYERFEEISVELNLESNFPLKSVKKHLYQSLESWEMPRHWKTL